MLEKLSDPLSSISYSEDIMGVYYLMLYLNIAIWLIILVLRLWIMMFIIINFLIKIILLLDKCLALPTQGLGRSLEGYVTGLDLGFRPSSSSEEEGLWLKTIKSILISINPSKLAQLTITTKDPQSVAPILSCLQTANKPLTRALSQLLASSPEKVSNIITLSSVCVVHALAVATYASSTKLSSQTWPRLVYMAKTFTRRNLWRIKSIFPSNTKDFRDQISATTPSTSRTSMEGKATKYQDLSLKISSKRVDPATSWAVTQANSLDIAVLTNTSSLPISTQGQISPSGRKAPTRNRF